MASDTSCFRNAVAVQCMKDEVEMIEVSFHLRSLSGVESGPHSFGQMMFWYRLHALHPLADVSTDEGRTWTSILELRCRNGPLSPFVHRDNMEELAMEMEPIMITREIVREAEKRADFIEKEMEKVSEVLRHMEDNCGKTVNRQNSQTSSTEDNPTENESESLKSELVEKLKKKRYSKRTKRNKAKLQGVYTERISNHVVDLLYQRDGGNADEIESKLEAVSIEKETTSSHADSGPSSPAEKPTENEEPPTPTHLLARPDIFPMLQASSVPAVNDSSLSGALLTCLRRRMESHAIPAIVAAATASAFDPPPICEQCENVQPLATLLSFMEHVLSEDHLNKIRSTGGDISSHQCNYWLDVVQTGYTSRRPL
ncbi:hypothetical protein PENTCL1PPCAC_28211 [Pristionchus entomophagus]|uniref:Uncharacterized protein n=1 Tax=Pristionchus entomophagus TaxID=358040 RepID=A0AAV5UGH1_9BILA|nr:hypothetical protein PENTCL1PPCAC_28211 [Pristionchus entomophagus]